MGDISKAYKPQITRIYTDFFMLLFEEKSYEIIGACFEVHKHLGSGFLETVYAEALAIELMNRGIPFEREKVLEIK